MSKIIAGSALVLLGGGTAVAGVVFLPKWLNSVDAELIDKLDTFKAEGQKEGCVRSLFGGDVSFSSVTTTVDDSDFNGGFLGTKTTGCLVVNWDKKSKVDGSTTKIKGTFRFLWAVKGESKGFVVYLSGTTTKASSGNNHQLSWSGTSYLMEKNAGGDTWTAKKQGALETNKVFASNETDTKKFPHPGEALTDAKDKNFWGFIGQASDLGKVVDDSELTDATDSSMRGYWTWEGQSSETAVADKKKLTDWTKDVDTWWKELFSSTTHKAKEDVEKQYGTWTKRVYRLLPQAVGGAGS